MITKILFILKKRDTNEVICAPSNYGHSELSSGLHNSAKFVCDALDRFHHIETKLVHVIDNNEIDREVTLFKPSIVIIEAFWVVPEKFEILSKLHPSVKWVIRNHSELPFAAQEGIIIDWMIKYAAMKNVYISGNSKRSYSDMKKVITSVYPEFLKKKVVYLPNIYPFAHLGSCSPKKEDDYLDVACFGAIRPLKNQLIQAVSAISFANSLGKKLRFHINGNRLEGTGSNQVLKNLRALFDKTRDHELIEHSWYPHESFIEVLKCMDIGMQVSFSETFNIVSADMTHSGIPIVTSKEVVWSPCLIHADPTETTNIIKKLKFGWFFRKTSLLVRLSQWCLNQYSKKSIVSWLMSINTLSGN